MAGVVPDRGRLLVTHNAHERPGALSGAGTRARAPKPDTYAKSGAPKRYEGVRQCSPACYSRRVDSLPRFRGNKPLGNDHGEILPGVPTVWSGSSEGELEIGKKLSC